MKKLFALVFVLALSIFGIIFVTLSSPLTEHEDVDDKVEYLILMGFPEEFIKNRIRKHSKLMNCTKCFMISQLLSWDQMGEHLGILAF